MVRQREEGGHTDEELQRRFEELDEDGSGKVDMAEYLRWSLRDALIQWRGAWRPSTQRQSLAAEPVRREHTLSLADLAPRPQVAGPTLHVHCKVWN